MKNNTVIVSIRLPASVVEQLEKFPWAKNKSDAIRIILEAFCSMSEEEQLDFRRKAAERKFAAESL